MIQWGATGRLARRYPRTTASVALANLLVLLGVVAFSWSVGVVLVVYWLETGVALLAAIAAALVANEVGDVDEQHRDGIEAIDPDRRIELRPGWPGLRVRNAAVVVPIGFVFGFFWVVHGVFVWAFAMMLSDGGSLPVDAWVLLAFLGVAVSRASELYTEQVVEERYRTATATGQLTSVFGRILALHVALILGAALVAAAASYAPRAGVAFLALLVALKAPAELAVATHSRASGDTLDRSSKLGDGATGRPRETGV